MSNVWPVILSVFQKSLTSIKGTINLNELMKTLIAAAGTGGSVWTVLTALQASLGTIIIDPTTLSSVQSILSMLSEKNYVGLGFFSIVLIADLARRYGQGVDITPSAPLIKEINGQLDDNQKVKIKIV